VLDIFLILTEHHLHTTADQSIVADHVHPFMTTVFHLQTSKHLKHGNEFTKLKWAPHLPDLNPIWDVVEQEIHILDVQPTNLQQHAIMYLIHMYQNL